MDSLKLADLLCKTLDSKKAQDVVKINVQDKTCVTDYFVVASGRSTTQVKSLCEQCEEVAEKAGATILRKEGLTDSRWAIVDFGDVILHVFNDETRLFYHLERLWGEGEKFNSED
ncbi:MAG: ribosome silencing factor [Clostridia bacterium]|nr:ribosome silencing factor [Clostridia bacterium]